LFTRAREALGTVDVCHAAAKSDELSGDVTGELVTTAGGMEGRTLHS